MNFHSRTLTPRRIAIVGGGISGLASAFLLARHHHVTVFEAAPRFGGHARTVRAGAQGDQPVDTGFIVFNYANYPHLTALFRDLEVPVERSDMSFGVSLQSGRHEYALQSLNALFATRRHALDPGFYRMIRDILHFNAHAEATMRPDLTIGDLIATLGLGQRFREHYLYPLCSAIWSTPASGIGSFPAQALIRFLRNHALLAKSGQHQWFTVTGGSVSYVDRLLAALRKQDVALRSSSPVSAIWRDANNVRVQAQGGTPEVFDDVVLACHADQALTMLANPTLEESAALSAIRFQDNHAVLHRDSTLMPNRRSCWSSWVYRTETGMDRDASVGVTYWMNRLQNIPQSDQLFVTLNPHRSLRDELVYDQTTFRHPVFDHGALAAQQRLADLQGRNNTWFAGAWLRNGFHEDGFASAMRIARRLNPQTVLA